MQSVSKSLNFQTFDSTENNGLISSSESKILNLCWTFRLEKRLFYSWHRTSTIRRTKKCFIITSSHSSKYFSAVTRGMFLFTKTWTEDFPPIVQIFIEQFFNSILASEPWWSKFRINANNLCSTRCFSSSSCLNRGLISTINVPIKNFKFEEEDFSGKWFLLLLVSEPWLVKKSKKCQCSLLVSLLKFILFRNYRSNSFHQDLNWHFRSRRRNMILKRRIDVFPSAGKLTIRKCQNGF